MLDFVRSKNDQSVPLNCIELWRVFCCIDYHNVPLICVVSVLIYDLEWYPVQNVLYVYRIKIIRNLCFIYLILGCIIITFRGIPLDSSYSKLLKISYSKFGGKKFTCPDFSWKNITEHPILAPFTCMLNLPKIFLAQNFCEIKLLSQFHKIMRSAHVDLCPSPLQKSNGSPLIVTVGPWVGCI